MKKTLVLAMVLLTASLVAEAQVKKVGDGLFFPEGAAFDGKGNISVSNCNADYITQYSWNDEEKVLHRSAGDETTFLKTNGMTYFKDGSLFVCDFGRKAIIRIYPNGKQEVYADKCNDQPFRGPNDLAFAPNGDLYFTDPGGSSLQNPIGVVYRVAAKDKKVTKLAEGFAFPNGIAFTRDAKTIYVAESQKFCVWAFPVKSDGTLGQRRLYVQLPKDHQPDGIGVDTAGNLWIAPYGGDGVVAFDKKGKLVQRIKLPGRNTTNLEFAGADLRTLYITEAETGGVYKTRVKVAGLRLFCAPPNQMKAAK